MSIHNPVAFIGETILGSAVNSPLSTDSNGAIANGLMLYTVSSTSSTTTTSGSDVALNSMTITPIAGTYYVIFDTTVQSTTGGNSINISIYVGGSQITNSSRVVQFPTATLIDSGYPFTMFTQAPAITVNGSQAIAIEWHTSGGTATCLNRTLTCIKTL